MQDYIPNKTNYYFVDKVSKHSENINGKITNQNFTSDKSFRIITRPKHEKPNLK